MFSPTNGAISIGAPPTVGNSNKTENGPEPISSVSRNRNQDTPGPAINGRQLNQKPHIRPTRTAAINGHQPSQEPHTTVTGLIPVNRQTWKPIMNPETGVITEATKEIFQDSRAAAVFAAEDDKRSSLFFYNITGFDLCSNAAVILL
jgi:hypothetical protein